MSYHIKFYEMPGIQSGINASCSQWNAAIESTTKSIQSLIDLESFSGATKEAAKAYFMEVHGLFLGSLSTMLSEYSTRFIVFMQAMQDLDGSKDAEYADEELEEIKTFFNSHSDSLVSLAQSINEETNSVSDLISVGPPSSSSLENGYEDIIRHVKDFDQAVTDFETQHSKDLTDFANLLAEFKSAVAQYRSSDKSITAYQPGDIGKISNAVKLAESLKIVEANMAENKEEIMSAIEENKILWSEIEKEGIEARKKKGFWQLVGGAGAVFVGVACIVVTAGAATPIVVAGALAGGSSVAYGLSEAYEGKEELKYGFNNDYYSSALNPLRDSIFGGNQEAYDIFGNVSVFAASVMIPVGQAGKLAEATTKSAFEVGLKRGILEEGMEWGVNKGSQWAADQIGDAAGLNGEQKATLGMVMSMGLSSQLKKVKGISEVNHVVDGGDAADLSRKADAVEMAADETKAAKAATVLEPVETPQKRPSWRQSEIDVGKEYPGYKEQQSFLNGEPVKGYVKGSSRPEYYTDGHAVEVKNYNLTRKGGPNSLATNVSKQVDQRITNLPAGTRQTVVIDVRGQNVSHEVLQDVKQRILDKLGPDKVNQAGLKIRFKRK